MARSRRMQTPSGDEDFSLDHVMPHHRAAWRVERIGWAVGLLALAAALAGLFGYGPVSRTTVGTPDMLQVEYDRLQRSSAPTDYAITVNAALARKGTLRLRFDRALMDDIEFDDIVPEPERVVAGTGYVEFVFNVAPDQVTPARITFRFRPVTFGHSRGRLAIHGAPPVLLDQTIYP